MSSHSSCITRTWLLIAAGDLSIVELLGVANDGPEEILLPVLEKQADEINFEWRDRFQREAPDWESWFPLPDF